jgi:hypothetical protein
MLLPSVSNSRYGMLVVALLLAVAPALPLEAQSAPIGADRIRPLGSSLNIYSILLEQQNQVAYNAELNALVFGHRQGPGIIGGSGGLSFDRSLDGGATWQLNNAISPGFNSGAFPDVIGHRFPNAAIANLNGNTDPAQALAFLQGPAITFNTPYFWGKVFGHSARLSDGGLVQERYTNAIPGVDEDYHPMGLTALGNGRMISVSTRFREQAGDDFDRLLVHIGNFDTAQNRMRWTLATSTLIPDLLRKSDSSVLVRDGIPNLAFGPDGRVGYIVTLGARSSDPQATPTPIVYRSTNGGSDWEELPGYAFGEDPVMRAYLQASLQGDKLPYFDGFDMAVDRDDRLHLFARVRSRVSAVLDSVDALSTVPGDGGLFHCITRDGRQWDVALVDSLRNLPGALGAVEHPQRVQMSRSQDGAKVFFAWTASAGPLGSPNNAPNLYLRGYDVDAQRFAPVLSPTVGSSIDGNCWFPTVAPGVMESDTTVDWAIPTIIAQPSGSDLDIVDYAYLAGVGFAAEDFPQPVCNSSEGPRNQSHQIRSARVQLHWDPMPGSTACRVELQKLATGSSSIATLNGSEINSLDLGFGILPPGFAATWRVQCACSIVPLDSSAFTMYGDTFQLPNGAREMAETAPSSDLGMRIAPNPARDRVQVLLNTASGEALSAAQGTPARLRLIDAVGRTVLELPFQDTSSPSQTIDLNLAGVPEGWYLVEVQAGGLVQRERLVILR